MTLLAERADAIAQSFSACRVLSIFSVFDALERITGTDCGKDILTESVCTTGYLFTQSVLSTGRVKMRIKKSTAINDQYLPLSN